MAQLDGEKRALRKDERPSAVEWTTWKEMSVNATRADYRPITPLPVTRAIGLKF
jgi:hypothetical protein